MFSTLIIILIKITEKSKTHKTCCIPRKLEFQKDCIANLHLNLLSLSSHLTSKYYYGTYNRLNLGLHT